MDGQSYEDYKFYQQKQMGAMTMITYVNKVQASDRVHTSQLSHWRLIGCSGANSPTHKKKCPLRITSCPPRWQTLMHDDVTHKACMANFGSLTGCLLCWPDTLLLQQHNLDSMNHCGYSVTMSSMQIKLVQSTRFT